MTKELFVSSTPHETKIGMVEDDLLAEVYLERENEYTLAGSIYKGRVTRVLPGMQSAFVDIGLERDAFLYVSDFMELENQDDDLDEIPATPIPEFRSSEATAEPVGVETFAAESSEGATEDQPGNQATPAAPREDRDRGSFRGRRRRGRRDRGPESRFSRPQAETRSSEPRVEARPESRPERDEYGPPPGYQPIVLPGESISKYRGFTPATPAVQEPTPSFESRHEPAEESFPQDEPLFASAQNAVEELPRSETSREPYEAVASAQRAESETAVGSDDWDREQRRRHEMNVAAVFGGEESHPEEEERGRHERKSAAPSANSAFLDREEPATPADAVHARTMEEEEIDEEEADLAAYVEELEEDAAFDEFEEETHAAADATHPAAENEIAAGATESGENGSNVVPFSSEAVSAETAEVAQADEDVEEVAADEAELEEAQAEAEALLAAEAIGDGTVDARVEVRAPAATAAFTQRAPRPAFDRDRDRSRRGGPRRSGGGGGGGGRRFRRNEPQNLPQITDLLKEGQEILVQIAKEPIGKKGARITSHIALPGRFLVYMPTVNHTGVSRKIASEEERLRLKRIIQSERENGHGGFIVRTAAQNADEQELRADIRFLKGLWNEIRTRAENSNPPALIYHDLNVVERILRDQVTSDFSAIWVDTEQEYERILRFANRFQPALVRRVKLYTKEAPLFEQFGLKDEIDKALKSKVWLKSGGYIVINQTEALVAIDVNTGKYVGKTARLEDTIVKTNVDAIKEIVRQIRLRDLGGIIVIDFIDMDERRNRQKVMQALEEALRSDRSPSKVLQFNDFGLVAITRKRVKQSLERTIGSPCPYCEATGFVKNVNTVCNEIYIEMRKIAQHVEHSDVMLRVNPEVAKALKSNNGRWLNELEELTKKTVIVKSDPALHQEKFDIN